MGMYVCKKCFDRNQLRSGNGMDHYGSCEICGHVYGDWAEEGGIVTKAVWVGFTNTIDRPIMEPNPTAYVLNQLINWRGECNRIAT